MTYTVSVSRTRKLSSNEVADAAAVAALTFSLAAIGRLIAAGTFFQVISTVAFAVLASRRRTRVVAVSGWAAASMGVLLGGIGPLTQLTTAAIFGGTAGAALKRGWGVMRAIALSLLIGWPIIAGATIGMLSVMTRLRELNFENFRNLTSGVDRMLDWVDGLIGNIGLGRVGDELVDLVDLGIRNWYIATPLVQIFVTIGYTWLTFALAKKVGARVQNALGDPIEDHRQLGSGEPIPLSLTDVTVMRGGTPTDVVGVEMNLRKGDFITILGPNGSGKSTLLHAIAGLDELTLSPPIPDGVSIGKPGGTALIGQRPDAQVLAPRVGDDLIWGLDPSENIEVGEVLAAVGLAGFEQRDTSALSGGELQRLAIGGALARRPSLLLSDESTAMLDPEGRRSVHGLLQRLSEFGTAVVHATHLTEEVPAQQDQVLRLGKALESGIGLPVSRPEPGAVVLRAEGLDVVHDAGSPWAAQALFDINLELRASQLTLVTGANGSGKSTLAWTLAGLTKTTEGKILLHDELVSGPDPGIAIAFQHARLQVLQPRVAGEIQTQCETEDVMPLLKAVGLTTPGFENRRIDELSGGELRRVLLAGILGRKPDVLILDEPLAGLDNDGRQRLRHAVEQFLSRGVAVVVVTHEPEWARELADQQIHLTGGSMSLTKRGSLVEDQNS